MKIKRYFIPQAELDEQPYEFFKWYVEKVIGNSMAGYIRTHIMKLMHEYIETKKWKHSQPYQTESPTISKDETNWTTKVI